jgi:hypothetical protein
MVHGTQGMDALPVAKVVLYPREERDYKPFAQNILCVSEGTLCLRMWAFEVSPTPGSELTAMLYLFEDEPLALRVHIAMEGDGTPSHRAVLVRDGAEAAVVEGYAFHNHSGEDLQGVYWGGEVRIDLTLLEKLGGKTKTQPGDSFPGNFYKMQSSGANAHFGSFTPTDWDNPYKAEGMGIFTVVDY